MQISLQETTWKWVVGGLHAAARGATCGQGDVWDRSEYISFTRNTSDLSYANDERYYIRLEKEKEVNRPLGLSHSSEKNPGITLDNNDAFENEDMFFFKL